MSDLGLRRNAVTIVEHRPEWLSAFQMEASELWRCLGDIVVDAGLSLTDEDSNILSRYREEARRRIADFTQSPGRADEILSVVGWDLVEPPEL